MGIFRVRKDKENPYVMLSKKIIDDNRLSWQAKGILIYLISKPDNWTVYEADIIASATNGRDSVKKAIKELEEFGYLRKEKKRDEKGKFIGWEYYVFENPQDDITDIRKNRCRENRHTEKPTSANPQLINNEYKLNNEINNNIYTQPQEVEGGISEEKPEEEPKEKPKEESKKEPKEPKPKKPRIKYDEKFEAMWNGYRSNAVETPAGSKKQAYEVYKKLLKYYDAETILAHARYYLKDCIKTKTKTKHLVNFLKKEDFDTPVEELYESAREDKKKKKIDIKVLG